MNIVIMGAGRLGTHLATALSQQEHNVFVIDPNEKALDKLARVADIATCIGSGSDWELLEELLEHQPDLFIALTGDDESNLVACSLAKNLGYPKTVARLHRSSGLNRTRLDLGRLFFVDHFLDPELIVAHEIFKYMTHPGIVAIENFAHGAVQMRTFKISDKWEKGHCKLSELNFQDELLIALIKREDEVIFPRGEDQIFPGDEITLIGEAKVMEHLPAIFGITDKKVSSAVVVGGSRVALHLCHLLEARDIPTKLFEKEQQKCHLLAENLKQTTILNLDGLDPDALSSEKIGHTGVFVACTSSDETNIVSASLAKFFRCEEVIALVADASYLPLLKKMEIASIISEEACVTARIQSIIEEGNVIAVASLYENRAKIIEIKVSADSEIVGIPLADLRSRLPKDFLIALIENRGKISVAKGNHILCPGDTAIVISCPKHIHELEGIFYSNLSGNLDGTLDGYASN